MQVCDLAVILHFRSFNETVAILFGNISETIKLVTNLKIGSD